MTRASSLAGKRITLAMSTNESKRSSFFFPAAVDLAQPILFNALDVEVFYIQRIVFDEFAAGFHVFAHKGGEDGLSFGNVLELH